MQLFKLLSVAALCSISGQAAARFTDEQECMSSQQHVSSDLSEALQKAWWSCSAAIIERLAQSSSVAALDDAFQTEQRAITKQLNALKSLLESSKPGMHLMLRASRKTSHWPTRLSASSVPTFYKTAQEISPAFEWAQSPDEVYINVKFAHKLDTPATLGVTIDAVDITADRLVLKGSSPGRKHFLLDLSLYGTVDPDSSSWSSGSVGRMTIQLKKQQTKPSKWPVLVSEGSKKLQNMHMWWSKHELYSDALDDIEDSDNSTNTTTDTSETAAKTSNDSSSNSKSDSTSTDTTATTAAKTSDTTDTVDSVPLTATEVASKARQARIDAAKADVAARKKEALAKLDAEFKAKQAELRGEKTAKRDTIDKQFAEEQSQQIAAARQMTTTATSDEL
jgi:CS domain